MTPTQKAPTQATAQAAVSPPTPSEGLERMDEESLKQLCTAPGPFITIFLPASHPGAADLPRTERMKEMVQEAELELKRRRFPGSIPGLLKPLQEFAESPAAIAGGNGSAIFTGPGFFRHFRLHPAPGSSPEEAINVATHPHITPILSNFIPEREFYVLAISKKLLRLGRWRGGACREVPLPPSVPKSFEDTLILEQPDHELQSRAPSGSGSAQGGIVRFGIGGERDSLHDLLHNYLHAVDRELGCVLKGAPLVIVAVAEELAAYRAISNYPRLLAAQPTSPEHLSWVELGESARKTILEARQQEADLAFGQFQETTRRDHAISGVRAVLEAAREGRVHRLFLKSGAAQVGLLGPSFSMDDPALVEGKQDLINAIAVETIRRGGEVYTLHGDKLGDCPVAALLRYAVAETPIGEAQSQHGSAIRANSLEGAV